MTLDEAKSSIGEMVMTRHPRYKLVSSLAISHGPYKLLQVTKAGLCILEGYEEFRVKPSLISKKPLDKTK